MTADNGRRPSIVRRALEASLEQSTLPLARHEWQYRETSDDYRCVRCGAVGHRRKDDPMVAFGGSVEIDTPGDGTCGERPPTKSDSDTRARARSPIPVVDDVADAPPGWPFKPTISNWDAAMADAMIELRTLDREIGRLEARRTLVRASIEQRMREADETKYTFRFVDGAEAHVSTRDGATRVQVVNAREIPRDLLSMQLDNDRARKALARGPVPGLQLSVGKPMLVVKITPPPNAEESQR